MVRQQKNQPPASATAAAAIPPCPRRCLQGFIRPSSRAILVSGDTPGELIDTLAAYQAPPSLLRLASEGKLGVHERG